MKESTELLVRQIVDEAEANMSSLEVKGRGVTLADAAEGDVQRFFCEHWDNIKTVIEFLGGLGGAWGRLVAKVLIEIGDRYHKNNC